MLLSVKFSFTRRPSLIRFVRLVAETFDTL